MGVRVEHPQRLIDAAQYHMPERGEYLPAASYSLVEQVGGRGVYSFCMCPGGFIVPAMTGGGESVVNGMSPSGRNSVFANSGIVTEVRLSDFEHLRSEHGPETVRSLRPSGCRISWPAVAAARCPVALTCPASRRPGWTAGFRSSCPPRCAAASSRSGARYGDS